MNDQSCVHCPRTCPRCGYNIPGNFEHIERPQAAGSNVVVCGLRRLSRPIGEAVSLYLDHAKHESVIQRQATTGEGDLTTTVLRKDAVTDARDGGGWVFDITKGSDTAEWVGP